MATKLLKSIRIIVSPYHVGIREHRVGTGPIRILDHSLIPALQTLNVDISTTEIEPVDDFEGEIGRSFEILRRISKEVTKAREANSFPIVLAGNCNATVGISAGLGTENLGCVWFDAHADYDTPETNMSGYFDAMGVSMLAGESWQAMLKSIPNYRPLNLERFVYCGVRDLTDPQREQVEQGKMTIVWGEKSGKVDYAADLSKELAGRDIDLCMVHVDIDCLDAAVYGDLNGYAAPDGLLESDLISCLEMLPSKVTPASLTLASLAADREGGEAGAEIATKAIRAFVKSMLKNNMLSEHTT